MLDGSRVSHLEQADDVVLFSTTAQGLQQKLNELFAWCKHNFMLIHEVKTQCMIFGPLPPAAPHFYVDGALLKLVSSYRYVGVRFTSTAACIFTGHRVESAASARGMANASLALESYIGALPAWMYRSLYVARVDPHLTYGCEVAIDLSANAVKELAEVQHTYWRRALGLNGRCALTPLYTETGLQPLRYRRVTLTLRFLLYLLTEKPQLPTAALNEALHLARTGAASWISDLWHALRNLPIPVPFTYGTPLTIAYVSDTLMRVGRSLELYLRGNLEGKLILLKERREWSVKEAKLVQKLLCFRDYLRIPNRDHRVALTRLLCSDHPLAIEQGRRTVPPTPKEWRVCRFCGFRGEIETEWHVILDCEEQSLSSMREEFFTEALQHVPVLLNERRSLTSFRLLLAIMSRYKLVEIFARFIWLFFELCETLPMRRITSEAEFLALPTAQP